MAWSDRPVVGHIVLERFPIGSLVRICAAPSEKTWAIPRDHSIAGRVLRVLRYSTAGYDTVGFYAGDLSGRGGEVARVFWQDAAPL